MKILIDGDSCCVVRITERIAKRYRIDCHIYCDSRRVIESGYSTVHFTDVSKDAADFAIIGQCRKYDIVITSDGGLASMALTRGARVLNPYGGEYTEQNIMQVLYYRDKCMKANHRKRKKQTKNPSPLSRSESYKDSLHRIVQQNLEAQRLEDCNTK